MPMPHRTQMQLIRRRLVGKEGAARARELRAILAELPDYRNGPYADLRKWVHEEIERSLVRHRSVHRDSIAIRRQGDAQIALVGAPNAGKSSLLQALSHIRIKTGDYAFTTTRPVAAACRIGGILVQLVEIPGLLEGARDDRGGGRALLGVLRGADGIVYCHAATEPLGAFRTVHREVVEAGIDLPSVVALTRADEVDDVDALRTPLAREHTVVTTSVLDDTSLDRLRDAIRVLTGLVRVHLRKGSDVALDPVALPPPVTVADVADVVHHDLGVRCTGARVWGPSARFPGQRVGRHHELADLDEVEVLG
jgi:small GTP-binding protein